MTLIDTHAHLDDRDFDADRAAVIARAREANVRAIINVGYNEARWATTAALCAAHPDIYAVLGCHPHEAAAWSDAVGERLRSALRGPKVVGLGEIGLDFYRDYAPHDCQRAAFRAQLALARELDLPVVIHSRAAEDEVVATLAEFGITRGVLHSFSGALATAERALALGLHISLTGPVSYPKADHQRDLARLIPRERLLLETDCPYLAPQPRRGKRNEPAFLRFTAEAIATARSEEVDTVIAATGANAVALFGLPVGRLQVRVPAAAGGSSKLQPANRQPATAAPTLVLATTNPGKIREYHRLLAAAGLSLHVVGLDTVGLTAPPETGTTFAENAILKAVNAATLSGLPALADDSGLVVDALDGAPGVYSARYAGPDADDEANRRRLIAALAAVPAAARTGRFICAIALAQPDGTVAVVEGVCAGHLLTTPRGSNGFGYDPLFSFPDRGVTMAELSLDEKNAISHRAQALARAVPLLRQRFAPETVGPNDVIGPVR